jgi:hypothetical protein
VGVVDPVPGGDERNARSTACTAPAARTSNPNRRNHLRLTATRLTLGDREGRVWPASRAWTGERP